MGLFDFIGDITTAAAVKIAVSPVTIVKDAVNFLLCLMNGKEKDKVFYNLTNQF